MGTTVVEKSNWATTLQSATRQLENRQVEIEVASLAIGDQIAAEWVPLQGLAYDFKDDAIQVIVDDLEHVIRAPVELATVTSDDALTAIVVTTQDGTRQIIRFRKPLD
jgi:hypothetical protein